MSKKEVIKRTGALTCSGELTRLEQVIFNSILGYFYNDLPKNELLICPLEELRAYGKLQKNLPQIKRALARLVDIKLEYDLLNADGSGDWLKTSLLGSARIINGVLRADIPIELRQLLCDEERTYAKINLLLSSKLTSKYGLKMYELCLMWLGGRNKGESGLIDNETLRKLFGCQSRYLRPNDFYNYALKKGMDEVNNNANLHIQITAEPRRMRRKIVGWRFEVRRTGGDQNVIEQKIRPQFEDLANQKEAREKADFQALLTQSIHKFEQLSAGDRVHMQDQFKEDNQVLMRSHALDNGELDFTATPVRSTWQCWLIRHFFPPQED